MQDGTDRLKVRIKMLQGIVNADAHKGAVRQNLDPERTCFVINPPRQFPSKTSLAMFLAENPEIAAKHEALVNPKETAEHFANADDRDTRVSPRGFDDGSV